MKYWLSQLLRSPYPTITVIIAVEFVIFFFQKIDHFRIIFYFGMVPIRVKLAFIQLMEEGTYDLEIMMSLMTIMTALFLHADAAHIVFNMVFLWTFGGLVHQHLGKWWTFFLFFIVGVSGNATQFLLKPASQIPVIGASGAVYGFMGIYLGLALRRNLSWPHVWPLSGPVPPMQMAAFAVLRVGFDIYSLINGQKGIAFGAHIGGFYCGVMVGLVASFFYPAKKLKI